MNNFKSKKGVPVTKEFALINWSYMYVGFIVPFISHNKDNQYQFNLPLMQITMIRKLYIVMEMSMWK